MKTIHVSILMAVLAAGISNASHADFNLEKLKALADRVKTYQDKANQGPQTPSSTPSETPASQAGNGTTASSSEVDQGSIKVAREKWDVLGIKIGMSLNDALKQLKTRNPNLRILETRTQKFADADNKDHPYLVILIAGAKPRPPEEIYLKVSMPPGQHVVYVRRIKRYTKNEAPTMDAVITALRDKYGNQPERGMGDNTNYANRHLLWQVGNRPGGNTVCEASAPLNPNIRPLKGCEIIAVSGNVQPFQDNPAVVSELTITAYDLVMSFDDSEKTDRFMEEARNTRKKIELDDAKKKTGPIL